jgi:hypothetical protein
MRGCRRRRIVYDKWEPLNRSDIELGVAPWRLKTAEYCPVP